MLGIMMAHVQQQADDAPTSADHQVTAAGRFNKSIRFYLSVPQTAAADSEPQCQILTGPILGGLACSTDICRNTIVKQ